MSLTRQIGCRMYNTTTAGKLSHCCGHSDKDLETHHTSHILSSERRIALHRYNVSIYSRSFDLRRAGSEACSTDPAASLHNRPMSNRTPAEVFLRNRKFISGFSSQPTLECTSNTIHWSRASTSMTNFTTHQHRSKWCPSSLTRSVNL